ncbi:YcxB family protein [Thalassomonas sp. M1454]|uniref:YcxB family protein n=1 Tax=Thalassomonas sp. M1454 TaxID=2594477 RepID=UPI00117E43A5|nr:YcxB family protein [Thalassomonas sp. M1454]TRX53174.1 YcxB family protein [Thalassomonas sp. M1454]
MNYTTSFTLDRAHYKECFEQSNALQPKSNSRFIKPVVMVLFGLFFYATKIDGISAHLGAFFFILAFVEVLNTIYARGWWVTRQMLSKAAGNDVTISLNETGLDINSDFVKQSIQWTEITSATPTEKGLVLKVNNASHYLSKSCFSEDAWQFINSKVST